MTAVADFVIPEGYTLAADRVSRCRSCSAEIVWTTTRRGHRAPLNADGTSHFSTCPQSDRWRRSDAEAAQALDEALGPRNIRQIVSAALRTGLDSPQSVAVSERTAIALVNELRADGYEIHLARLCVRPGDPEKLGRAMTQEEAAAFLAGTTP